MSYHSLNSTEYEYNCGCAGYARDKTSFIAFTVYDPKNPETLNNRKTTRQIFAYRPGNGLLMQSRLYNSKGGTHGVQEETKLYRDLIQREISDLEGVPNLWKTHKYCDGKESTVYIGKGFDGYAGWAYREFAGKVSIRVDREDDFESLTVGTYGLCVVCAKKIECLMYCSYCYIDRETCDWFEDFFDDDMYRVHNSNGDEVYVCHNCCDGHYSYCERCDEYYTNNEMSEVDGRMICRSCLDEYYEECADCGCHHCNDDMWRVYDSRGCEVSVCKDCQDRHYTKCSHCGEYVHTDSIVGTHDVNGNDVDICDCCRDNHYEECVECGEIFDADVMIDNLCPDCKEVAVENNEGTTI
jgi:hypothetical protein